MSQTAVPVLAVQSGTHIPWELVRNAESQAPLPPTEPEPAFAQDGQVAPRNAKPHGCNETDGRQQRCPGRGAEGDTARPPWEALAASPAQS